MTALYNYTLQLADTALIHCQRLGEWCGHAPALEVDIAISNIALDHIGAARSFYQYAAPMHSSTATEDSLAYMRTEREYRNFLIAELPNNDFAFTLAKCFYLDVFNQIFYSKLSESSDETISAIAQKSLKEVNYHTRFSSEWVIRTGDGTPESKQFIQQALDKAFEYSGEFFIASEADDWAQKNINAPQLASLQAPWLARVQEVLEEATLQMPHAPVMQQGGKNGLHTEHLGFILAEMQHMQRAYPNMEW